ncbi:MAG: tetratricopeptide repeat protein [Spirochaetota bacterium]
MRVKPLLLLVLLAAVAPAPAGPGFAQSTAVQLYRDALLKESEGDCLAAVFLYQDALQHNPYYLDAKLGLARCYLETGSLQPAEETLHSALAQAPGDVRALNLLGRVYTAMKRYQEAEQAFTRSLEREPGRLETRYHLADLYRARGDYQEAADLYSRILKIHPRDTRAYLYLGIVYTQIGDLRRAGSHFRKAVSLDSQDPQVRLNLARHYYRMGVSLVTKAPGEAGEYFDAALQEAATALVIREDYPDALELTAEVHFYRGDYREAARWYRGLLEARPGDHLVSYSLGFCHEQLDDLEEAARVYERALGGRVDDEVLRFRLEETVLEVFREQLDHPLRVRLSDHHFQRGSFLMERNLMGKAFLHFKRAVMLHPLDPDRRLALAGLLRMQEFYERYLFELRAVIRDTLDVRTEHINDLIEIYTARTGNNLASRWEVDQYEGDDTGPRAVSRSLIRVAVLDAFSSDYVQRDYLHPRLSRTIRDMLALTLGYSQRVQVVEDPGPPGELLTREDALRRARLLEADYYVTGRVRETAESVELQVQLRSGLNGRVTAQVPVYYTGNHRLFNAVVYAAGFIEQSLPLYGKIARLRGDRALINLGRAHGVEEGDRFVIIQEGGLHTDQETGELTLKGAEELGTLRVTEVDEMVSEGTYTHRGRYNRVNVYDVVMLAESGEAE